MENTSTTEVLKSLESLYLKGEFGKALELLIKSKTQFPTAEFHYNMGTVLAKQGDFAAARYNFELAIKNGTFSSAIKNNLEFTKTQLAITDISNSRESWELWLDRSLSVPYEATFSIVLVLLLGLTLLFRFNKIKSKIVYGLVSALLLAIPLCHMGLHKKFDIAINLKDQEIYEGPSSVYDSIGKLDAGAKIILGQIDKDWVMVEYPLKYAGWVKRETLGNL
ncbi:hypothetical protein HBN50_17005 [Halobacteriovorax sp. GB3]|uniref:tetratricopeptide repeat protein n=1 Tax=Halobacteriovorax sp. GB3 TaxID=2719615 RepID=UPI0023609B40|nr:hypothetical protein [Halobacteriovorax sp. GB3]MDD0854810.1 hypothetical protein [Halobacteriovorax sp. GB3]